tara:strand:- start:85 stop:492 length:408 start_codon:yes stop_codon:yes gene_type:complete
MQSDESQTIITVLKETLDQVKGLHSITISTDEGNELIAVHATNIGDTSSSVNRDRAAVFAGAAEQVLKLGKGGMNVTTAFYSSQVAVLVLTKPLIISIVGDLESSGLDLAKIRLLVEPLKAMVEPLRQSVTESRT